MLKEALESHRQGNYAEAENKYREMLAQEPENFELLHLLAVLKQETGILDEALELINQAIDLKPEAAAYFAARGSIFNSQGNVDGAVADLEKALELNPNLPHGHNTLGFLQFIQGQLDTAETTLQMALKLDPDSSQVRTNLGSVLLAKGQTEDAVRQLQSALEGDPDSLAARVTLGRAFLAQGAAAFAEECFRACLEKRPDSNSVKALLGHALLASKQVDVAASLFSEVLIKNPEQFDALVGAADVALARRQFAAASRAYQQVLIRNRDHTPSIAKLADCLTELGEFGSAIGLYQSLRGRFGDAALVGRNIGRAQMLSGDLQESVNTLNQLLEDNPEDSEAAVLLAESLKRDGKQDQVRAVLEAVPDRAALYYRTRIALAKLDLSANDANQALEHLAGLGQQMLGPTDRGSIHELRGRSLDALGRHAEAADAFALAAAAVTLNTLRLRPLSVNIPLASLWSKKPPDDGRGEPIFLVAMPGSGVGTVVAALDQMPEVEVLQDRFAAPRERGDFLVDHDHEIDFAEIGDAQIILQRRRYWHNLRRLRQKTSGRVMAIDWLPLSEFDPVAIARCFPNAVVMIVHRHPADQLLHARSLGWRQETEVSERDLTAFYEPLIEAKQVLGLRLLKLDFGAMLAGECAPLEGLFAAMENKGGGFTEALNAAVGGQGLLSNFWPEGHWRHYADSMSLDSAELQALAKTMQEF